MTKSKNITRQSKNIVTCIVIAATFVIAILSVTAYHIGKAIYYAGY